MAKYSKIEWTHHTFNPWWGCTKVSEACKNCYAETWARRVGHDLWGNKKHRRLFSTLHWLEPYKWNKQAELEKKRHRVFCASMADLFERRKELNPWREKLWLVIEETPWLDWLLLTKRPQLIESYSPWKNNWPSNIWLGTTVELQKWADVRIPELVKFSTSVRFVSCEPLLGPLNIEGWLGEGINWVIAGGESGCGARPMQPAWVQTLRDQCLSKNVPFHFKQWGHWAPDSYPELLKKHLTSTARDQSGSPVILYALGKKLAGRKLDGETWDGFPNAKVA